MIKCQQIRIKENKINKKKKNCIQHACMKCQQIRISLHCGEIQSYIPLSLLHCSGWLAQSVVPLATSPKSCLVNIHSDY